MHRPEPSFDGVIPNNLEYTYDALVDWIVTLRGSDNFILCCRLQQLAAKMNGLMTVMESKFMLQKYCGKNRTLWSTEQHQSYCADCAAVEAARNGRGNNVLDEMLYIQAHDTLSKQMIGISRQLLKFFNAQRLPIDEVYQDFDRKYASAEF